jgi:hypothetical protein
MQTLKGRVPFGIRDPNDHGIFDKNPLQVPFPIRIQFSIPARYHTPGQRFQIGDLVWYELRGTFQNSNDYIQWGEGIVKQVNAEDNVYTLAGKTWNYDHYTHPLIGTPNGPSSFSKTTTSGSKTIYRRWAQTHHPNSHVRRNALLGVDEVMHPGLRAVPGEAMFKVWDREFTPQNPIYSLLNDDNDKVYGDIDLRSDNITIEIARDKYGPDLQYQGVKQNGLGPEMWGISLEQLLEVKDLEGYQESMLMYEVVEILIKPQTKGKGIGYALLLNGDQPLRAKCMTSHAWGERYDHFVRAIQDSNVNGPFWVCAMSIYQNEDIPLLTISKQLGPSLENGPFATVLKQAITMVAVFTPAVDIYTRMWCVFDIFFAVKYNVPVQFVALSYQFRSGMENMYDAIIEHGKKESSAADARCGDPTKPLNDDEKHIRSLIEEYPGKFNTIDAVIEWCKATYHIGEATPPGTGFRSDPDHYLLLGGPKRYDFLAKNLSCVALALDRLEESVSVASKEKTIGKEGNLSWCHDCSIM